LEGVALHDGSTSMIVLPFEYVMSVLPFGRRCTSPSVPLDKLDVKSLTEVMLKVLESEIEYSRT